MKSDDKDEVGYSRPPIKNRFKKGVSGNLRGRPKGRINAADMLRKELNRKVTIREGDKTMRVTKLEVSYKALMAKSMKGDIGAIKFVTELSENLLGDEIRKGDATMTWVDLMKIAHADKEED